MNNHIKEIDQMSIDRLVAELAKPLAQLQRNNDGINHLQIEIAHLKALILEVAQKIKPTKTK